MDVRNEESCYEVYNLNEDLFLKIYDDYKFCGISYDYYRNLVLSIISRVISHIESLKSYQNFIVRNVKISLDEYIFNLFKMEDCYELVDNYINSKFNDKLSLEKSVLNFSMIDRFLSSNNFIPNPDFLIRLLMQNKTVYSMTEFVYNRYQKQIVDGKTEQLFDNSFLISILESYCLINNIEIKEYSADVENYESKGNFDLVDAYLKDIGSRKLLSISEEKELALRISQGDKKARKKFIESNLKLVIGIARKYIGRGLDFADLIQEGNIGLMTAVDKFDYTKGFKFSTYATHWIRQSITRAISLKSRNIRIPVHVYEELQSYRKTFSELEFQLKRTPTVVEIASAMGLSVKKVSELANLQVDTVSMNTLINDEEDSELGDFIASDDISPDEKIAACDLSQQFSEIFESSLTEREIFVISSRFGLNGNQPETLEIIGEKLNVTRERVRQIEAKALRKLRMKKNSKKLEAYAGHPIFRYDAISYDADKKDDSNGISLVKKKD